MIEMSKKKIRPLTLKLICKYAFPRPFRDFELKEDKKDEGNEESEEEYESEEDEEQI